VREFWPLAEAEFPPTPFGTFLYSTLINSLGAPILFMVGDLAKAQPFAARAIARTHEGGDAYVEHGLRAVLSFRYLAEDDAELAWSEWSRTHQLYPGHDALRATTFGMVPAMYSGQLRRAELVLKHSRGWLFRWEVFLETARAIYLFWWGAVAAARLARGERNFRLTARFWCARMLMSLSTPPQFVPLRSCLQAAHAFMRGQHARGVRQLVEAQRMYEEQGARLYAAAASYALAQLHPDPALRALHADKATAVFEAEKIQRPERWVRALLPGLPHFERELTLEGAPRHDTTRSRSNL